VALRAALGRYHFTAPLLDGRVPGPALELASFSSILEPIRAMCRELAYDLCEMPLVTYLLARERGAAFTALPVFVLRRFPQLTMYTNTRTGSPGELAGKRGGARAYSDTTGTWSRGILAEMHGVGPMEWLVTDEEHVPDWPLPAGVRRDPSADVVAMLASGELALTLNIPSGSNPRDLPPDVRRLLPDEAVAAWYERTGVFPQSHTVVVRDELLDAAPALFDAFQAARLVGLRELLDEGPSAPWEHELHAYLGLLCHDPAPYGLEANRSGLERLVRYSREQGIISSEPKVDDVFASVG